MSERRDQLIRDAEAAGYKVQDDRGRLLIFKKNRRTGRVYRGLVLYEDGIAIDLTMSFEVAKGIRSYRDMRRMLGLEIDAGQKA